MVCCYPFIYKGSSKVHVSRYPVFVPAKEESFVEPEVRYAPRGRDTRNKDKYWYLCEKLRAKKTWKQRKYRKQYSFNVFSHDHSYV